MCCCFDALGVCCYLFMYLLIFPLIRFFPFWGLFEWTESEVDLVPVW